MVLALPIESTSSCTYSNFSLISLNGVIIYHMNRHNSHTHEQTGTIGRIRGDHGTNLRCRGHFWNRTHSQLRVHVSRLETRESNDRQVRLSQDCRFWILQGYTNRQEISNTLRYTRVSESRACASKRTQSLCGLLGIRMSRL